MDSPELLVVAGLSKRFGSTEALRSVSLRVDKGKVLGLAGENGAGKSTLVKILCGVYRADSGTVTLEGRPHRPRDPEESEKSGISVFHQEIPVCNHLSIAANVFLGPSIPRIGFAPDWKKMNARCVELYRTLLGEEIDPTVLIKDCTAAEKQLALLVRVLSYDAKLVILDEPTTALTPPEVERLFRIISKLRDGGMSFIFISHMLEELTELSDEITVFRDGQNVGFLRKDEFDRRTITSLIAGRALVETSKVRKALRPSPALSVRDLALQGEYVGVNFELGKGEILGIAGLQGSGRVALVKSLFGSPGPDAGKVSKGGSEVHLRNPTKAIKAGIGFIPEDRRGFGLFGQMDVKTNICIAGIDGFSKHGIQDPARLRRVCDESARTLPIKAQSWDSSIRSLSGGNQQKVLISRWLALRPDILLMIEPTRGVDVGAKKEIADKILDLSEEGYSFIISSTELDELLYLSDRVLVMNRGRVREVLSRDEATKERIIFAATT